MRLEHKPINFEDDRGSIRDIFTSNPKDHATVIVSKKGAIRGNHYHKASVQYVFIIEGEMEAYSQKPGEAVKQDMLRTGDLISHEPNESHAFKATQDTIFLAFADGMRGGDDYEKDTYRLDTPLV